jgi:hypothetical protein
MRAGGVRYKEKSPTFGFRESTVRARAEAGAGDIAAAAADDKGGKRMRWERRLRKRTWRVNARRQRGAARCDTWYTIERSL